MPNRLFLSKFCRCYSGQDEPSPHLLTASLLFFFYCETEFPFSFLFIVASGIFSFGSHLTFFFFFFYSFLQCFSSPNSNPSSQRMILSCMIDRVSCNEILDYAGPFFVFACLCAGVCLFNNSSCEQNWHSTHL